MEQQIMCMLINDTINLLDSKEELLFTLDLSHKTISFDALKDVMLCSTL